MCPQDTGLYAAAQLTDKLVALTFAMSQSEDLSQVSGGGGGNVDTAMDFDEFLEALLRLAVRAYGDDPACSKVWQKMRKVAALVAGELEGEAYKLDFDRRDELVAEEEAKIARVRGRPPAPSSRGRGRALRARRARRSWGARLRPDRPLPWPWSWQARVQLIWKQFSPDFESTEMKELRRKCAAPSPRGHPEARPCPPSREVTPQGRLLQWPPCIVSRLRRPAPPQVRAQPGGRLQGRAAQPREGGRGGGEAAQGAQDALDDHQAHPRLQDGRRRQGRRAARRARGRQVNRPRPVRAVSITSPQALAS